MTLELEVQLGLEHRESGTRGIKRKDRHQSAKRLVYDEKCLGQDHN